LARRIGPRQADASTHPRHNRHRLVTVDVVSQVQQVYELTGSIRETARVCRHSRDTVTKIVSGEHPNFVTAAQLAPGEQLLSIPERCRNPDCGAIKTVHPCRTCNVRRAKRDLARLQKLAEATKTRPAKQHPRRRRKEASSQLLLPLETSDGPLELVDLKPKPNGFDLLPQHARRLEQIRRHRRTHGIPFDGETPY